MHIASWEDVTPAVRGGGRLGAAGSAPPTSIATVIAAIRQAAKEKGFDLSDQLLSLMIGQIRYEGAYPGSGSTFAGTNNIGAAQVTPGLIASKAGRPGWGAFAHKDTTPTASGPRAYLGWYWIAPSPLEAARHWFGDNWWGPDLARANPQTPADYAAIVYRKGYFEGNHPDPNHDPDSDNGKQNVAEYAAGIQRNAATSAELAEKPDDPARVTVDPSKFKPLASRAITQDLFDAAKGAGGKLASLLPHSWGDLVASNGVVWFGQVPGGLWATLRRPAVAAGITFGVFAVGAGIFWATRRPTARRLPARA